MNLIQNQSVEESLNAKDHVDRAELYVKNNNLQAAIEHYKKAIEIDSNQPVKVYQKLGDKLLKNNELEQAEIIFQKLLQKYLGNRPGYIGLARVAMRLQQWKLAIQRWDVVIEQFPDTVNAVSEKARALTELGQFDQAEALFHQLSQKYPESAQGYEGLARIAQRLSQREQALKYWNISIQNSQAKSSYLGKVRLLVNIVQDDEAFELMDSLIKKYPDDLFLPTEKARLLISAQRFETAIQTIYSLPKITQEELKNQMMLASALIGNQSFEQANQVIDQIPNRENYPFPKLRYIKTWQKYYQQGIDFTQPKIFGIGLSKTGTTSLNEALNLLGYTSIHFVNPITDTVLAPEDFLYFDAFTDITVSFRFEELFFTFPNAKFIYTERDLDDWAISISKHYQKLYGFKTPQALNQWIAQPEMGYFGKRRFDCDSTHLSAVASLYANHSHWKKAYRCFEKRVKRFFKDKPENKLLRFNLCEEKSWQNLCEFLEIPVSQEAFPHKNKTFAGMI